MKKRAIFLIIIICLPLITAKIIEDSPDKRPSQREKQQGIKKIEPKKNLPRQYRESNYRPDQKEIKKAKKITTKQIIKRYNLITSNFMFSLINIFSNKNNHRYSIEELRR